MKVRNLKVYSGVTNWAEVLNNELNQVGFFVRDIGCKNYAIEDADGNPAGWRLYGHELTAEFKSLHNLHGICTAVFNLEKCTFEMSYLPKALYITSESTGAYISFIEYKKA
jgi:hypothetical protein